MENKKNKYFVIGLIGTFLFHAIVITLLFIFGYTTPLPLPQTRELEVVLDPYYGGYGVAQSEGGQQGSGGNPDSEGFRGSPESASGVNNDAVSYNDQNTDVQSGNNGSGNVSEKPSIDPRQTNYGGWGSGTTGGSDNNGTGRGGSGDSDGVGNGNGGGIGSAVVVGMGGRKISKLTTPRPDCKQAGIVAIDIEVNKNGKIVRATTNYNRCTTTSECLIEKAKEAALSSSFVSSAEIDQYGTIIYTFKVQ